MVSFHLYMKYSIAHVVRYRKRLKPHTYLVRHSIVLVGFPNEKHPSWTKLRGGSATPMAVTYATKVDVHNLFERGSSREDF